MLNFRKILRLYKHRFFRKINLMQISHIYIPKDCNQIVISEVKSNSGKVYGYYHFIVDLVLPIFKIITNNPHINSKNFTVLFDTRFDQFNNFKECYLYEHLKKLFDFNIRFISEEKEGCKKIKLYGYRSPFPRNLIIDIRKYMIDRFNIKDTKSDKVILIKRSKPLTFYKLIGANSGSDRRSIINHDELAQFLKKRYKEKFINAKLEHMDIVDQIKLFSQAKIIIGQHGAGLVNILWSENNKKVHLIEITSIAKMFRNLSEMKGINYHLYESPIHTNIDINDFNRFLEENCKD